jgi:hypothetical protein
MKSIMRIFKGWSQTLGFQSCPVPNPRASGIGVGFMQPQNPGVHCLQGFFMIFPWFDVYNSIFLFSHVGFIVKEKKN